MPEIEEVSAWLATHGLRVRRFAAATPTANLAAQALGCSPGEIAKSLLFLVGGDPVLVVAAGDMKVSSSLLKKALDRGGKVRLPAAEEVLDLTGYRPGGVCPFLLPTALPVLVDKSLSRFSAVYPAAGDDHSGVGVTPAQLVELTGGRLVELCRPLAMEKG